MIGQRRRRAALFLSIAVLVALCVVAWTLPALKMQDRVRGWLQEANVLPDPLPIYSAPNAPASRVTARRLVVAELHSALERGDFRQAAALNAVLSQEAFQRAFRVLRAWEAVRDPATGLLPWALTREGQEWHVGAEGANLYSHLLIAGHYLDPLRVELWQNIMDTERRVCGPIPCSLEFGTAKPIPVDRDTLIRSASEYTRDGLLTVTERLGRGLWYDRMVDGVEAILESAYIETSAGVIPANSTEVNGSQLQLLSRLYWITRDERYLQMAERIADTYLFEVLPANAGLPTDYWDFEARRPLPEDKRFRPETEVVAGVYPFRLADHGGEIISGLSELYFLERMLDRPQADRYRQPLLDLLDRLLAIGLNADGLWMQSVVPATGEPFDANLADTWGYVLSAYQTVDLADGTNRYAAEIESIMRTVTTQHSVSWEGRNADGYADTVESMLYLLPWFDIPAAHYWVDDEIEVMFLKQRDDGFVEGWFLDGNFVRTSLLYAQYKTQGVLPDPWTESLRLGAVLDRQSDTLYVYAASSTPWEGRLHFDAPRHRTFWTMPMEYPRVNGLPEWYPVEPEATYIVTDLTTGATDTLLGQALTDGLPLGLGGPARGDIWLAISRASH